MKDEMKQRFHWLHFSIWSNPSMQKQATGTWWLMKKINPQLTTDKTVRGDGEIALLARQKHRLWNCTSHFSVQPVCMTIWLCISIVHVVHSLLSRKTNSSNVKKDPKAQPVSKPVVKLSADTVQRGVIGQESRLVRKWAETKKTGKIWLRNYGLYSELS